MPQNELNQFDLDELAGKEGYIFGSTVDDEEVVIYQSPPLAQALQTDAPSSDDNYFSELTMNIVIRSQCHLGLVEDLTRVIKEIFEAKGIDYDRLQIRLLNMEI